MALGVGAPTRVCETKISIIGIDAAQIINALVALEVFVENRIFLDASKILALSISLDASHRSPLDSFT